MAYLCRNLFVWGLVCVGTGLRPVQAGRSPASTHSKATRAGAEASFARPDGRRRPSRRDSRDARPHTIPGTPVPTRSWAKMAAFMPRNPARLAAVAFLLIFVLATELSAQKPSKQAPAPQNHKTAQPQTPAAMGPTAAPPPRAAKTHARPGAGPPPKFVDVAQKLGLTASHISSLEKHYVIESMSGGIGLFDCDNDGRLDIIMATGSSVERYRQGGDPMVTLWRQEADGTFKDITQQAGMTRKGWGMGVAAADFDNDGNLDVYVTGYGGNVLYRNKGNCTFEDVTEKAGVRGGGFSTGAAWADYDRDGNVDLFVSRYVHVDMDHLPLPGSAQFCKYKGIEVQCGPWGMPGESDLLFHNRGDGTFEEVSAKAGVSDPNHYYGLGVVWGDYEDRKSVV